MSDDGMILADAADLEETLDLQRENLRLQAENTRLRQRLETLASYLEGRVGDDVRRHVEDAKQIAMAREACR